MNDETKGRGTAIHSLIPLADFKAFLGLDDREDCLAAFCLVTAAYTIEQYCKRRLLRRKHTDYLTFTGEYVFTFRKYPVGKVPSVHAARAGAVLQGEARFGPESLIDPKHYYCFPEPSINSEGGGSPLDEGIHENISFSLVLRPPYQLAREEMGIRVRYLAGYSTGKAGDPCGPGLGVSGTGGLEP
jgi:hypothetical protein